MMHLEEGEIKEAWETIWGWHNMVEPKSANQIQNNGGETQGMGGPVQVPTAPSGANRAECGAHACATPSAPAAACRWGRWGPRNTLPTRGAKISQRSGDSIRLRRLAPSPFTHAFTAYLLVNARVLVDKEAKSAILILNNSVKRGHNV